jgi:hypothetical protein
LAASADAPSDIYVVDNFVNVGLITEKQLTLLFVLGVDRPSFR